ncbi:MAG TPA: hypothetical protein VK213_07015 [Bacteroidales bacterium]|nr:hypothetical protein [Bacteroidales bacterium]
MKKLGIFVMLMSLISQGFSQEVSAGERKDDPEKKEIVIGKDFVKFSENDSSVNIKVGNRGLIILESLENDGTEIRIRKYSSDEVDDRDEYYYDENENDDRKETRRESRSRSFRGNWSGVEFGYNNYTTSDNSHYIPEDIGYMTVHSGKSHNLNINFAQVSLGITRHIGFVTGMGLSWNNYRFDRNNNIDKGPQGIIQELNPGTPLEKSKMTSLYLHVPFLLELQLPVMSNHLNISAGPIGAIKVASHSKMVFEDGNKVKSNSDFNLNLLRAGGTARFGYSNLQLYGTCYITPMFREGKAPGGYDLYPFEVGLAFTFNN